MHQEGTIFNFEQLKKEAISRQLTIRIGPALKAKMDKAGGELLVNMNDGSYVINGLPDELVNEILSKLNLETNI
jgi:hypothetical protein